MTYNNIGLYIGAPPSGQTTSEMMSGIGTPVSPDGSVESQVGSTHTYWEPNEIQTGVSRDSGNHDGWNPIGGRGGAGRSLTKVDRHHHNWIVAQGSRYGQAIGFSIATDGDDMVVGAPYSVCYSLGGSKPVLSASLDSYATQIWQDNSAYEEQEDCFGKINLEITGDLLELYPEMKAGDTNVSGKTFCWMDRVWVINTTPPGDSFVGGTAYGDYGGEEGTFLELYPCDAAQDCWQGDNTCHATVDGVQNSIGFITDEAGMTILERSERIGRFNGTGQGTQIQAGAVYVFKKPRGLITDATNTTPIVITTDGWNFLLDKLRGSDGQKRSRWVQGDATGAKIKIEGVGGNVTANGEYYLKYLTAVTAELYHDRDLVNGVAGGGVFKSGGSWKGTGPDAWIRKGVIEAPFPGGYSELNIQITKPPPKENLNICTGEVVYESYENDHDAVYYTDSRFGWSVDLKDGWVLIGEPRGKRWKTLYEMKTLDTISNLPREGSFAVGMMYGSQDIAPDGSNRSLPTLSQVSGDTSASGRVYIYHVDRAVEANFQLSHPNPHLNYSGGATTRIGKWMGSSGYIGMAPNARIVPEYLYTESEDPDVTYNMGKPREDGSLWNDIDTHFGHSVAFAPKIEGAPIGPDNPVTILVGAPYSRIDKNETGTLGSGGGDTDGGGDIAEDDIMYEPYGEDGVGGDEWFEGGGSGEGQTRGEDGERADRDDEGEGSTGEGWSPNTSQTPYADSTDPDAESPPKRERANRVGHAYAFIGAYPDSGNANYSVWKGLPNLYMGNGNIGSAAYNVSDIKGSGDYTINGLIGREKVDDGEGNMIDVVGVEDHYIWQRLEHRIYGHNLTHEKYEYELEDVSDGRAAQDRFGWSVALHGDAAIVGAPRNGLDLAGEDYKTDAGAAYVFTRAGHDQYYGTVDPSNLDPLLTKYVGFQQNPIAISGASNLHHRGTYDNFGSAVAIDDSFFAVGAPRHAGDRMGRDFSKGEGGAVFVWKKQPGGHYSFDQKLCHNNPAYGLYYGSHFGNTTDPEYIIGSGRDAYSHFGASLSLCGSNLLIGAPFAGGGLAYDTDAEHFTRLDYREKLSTEYYKGGDKSDQLTHSDNMNIKPLYRGKYYQDRGTGERWTPYSTDYTGAGRTYLFQRYDNIEDTRANIVTTSISNTDDATIVAAKKSYEDGSFTITAGGGTAEGQVYGIMRFEKLGIPRGSIIHNSYIDLTAAQDDDFSVSISIYAFDEDDGTMPTDDEGDEPGSSGSSAYSNFIAKLETTSTLKRVLWTVSQTKAGKKITTMPIVGIIQEIVDRPGWSDNNSIVIVFGGGGAPPTGADSHLWYSRKKSFYSSNYGAVYSGGDVQGVDTAPRLTVNFSETRDQWKQTHEFSPPATRYVHSKGDLPVGWEDFGRSVGLSKENMVVGCPEYEQDLLVDSFDGEHGLLQLIGGSGAIVHRDFVGLGCPGHGLPGTPGGNFPHIFSLNAKGHAFLDSEIDLYTKGFAVDNENITLTLPKAHAKFTHALPLHIGVKYDRGWTSLASKGHSISSNSMTLAMRDTPSGNISLFLKNFQYSGGMTLHSEGLRLANATAPLFAMSPLPSSGDITLHAKAHIPFNSPIGDFPEGHPSLYANGSPTVITATGPSLYTAGPILLTGSISVAGPYDLTASDKTPLYTRGVSVDNNTFNLFLEKGMGDIDAGLKLYSAGPIIPDAHSINLFTKYIPAGCTSSATSSHAIVKFTKQQTILGENVLGTEDGGAGHNMGGLWGLHDENYHNIGGKETTQSNANFYLDMLAQGNGWGLPADSPLHAYGDQYLYKNGDGIDVDGKSMIVATPGIRYTEKPYGYNYYPDINGLVKIYDWDGDTDSWTLSQTIKHPNDATEIAPYHMSFGSSVAIDDANGILVIGEYQLILTPSGDFQDPNYHGIATRDFSGQAHVYRKINGVWTYEATIDGATILSDGSTPSPNDKKGFNYQNSGQLYDKLGTYVAIDNGVIIAGAPGQSFGTDTTIQEQVTYSGAVYVFEYNSSLSRWERTQKLVNPDRALHVGLSGSSEHLDATYDASYFGLICKIKGDTIVVGAPAQTLKLKNGTVQASDGHLIDGAGAVYIFDKSGTWSFTKSFHSRGQGSTNEGTVDTSLNYATNHDHAANFGASLDFYGKNIVVGAPKKRGGRTRTTYQLGGYLAGEAYILEKSGGTWSLKYTLTPTETFSYGAGLDGNKGEGVVHLERDAFGYHVSIMNEDVVLIGSPKHDYGVAPSSVDDTAVDTTTPVVRSSRAHREANTGAIYVFGIQGGNQIHKLVREKAVENQFFGYNNVAFTQGCDAQIMSLTFGGSRDYLGVRNTSEEGNILELYQYLSAFPLNIRGPLESDSNISLLVDGVLGLTKSMPLFSEGMTPLNTSAGDPGDFPLMLLGPAGANATATLHTKGLSAYQTVFNLHTTAATTGPDESSDTYKTMPLKIRGPFEASSAGWPYWNKKDHRYARKFDINVRSGWHTDDKDAFHIGNSYPPTNYNADPPAYEWGDPILERGRSYVFDLSDESNAGHTFYLSTINDGGGGHAEGKHEGEFLIGVTIEREGADTGSPRATQGEQLHFNVPDDAPDYLYVHCGHHANMGWRIQIINQRASTPQGMSLYIAPDGLSTSNDMRLLIEGVTTASRGIRSDTSMNLFAKTRDIYPISSGINLYTRSVGTTSIETSKYTNLYLQSSDIAGEANAATQMNMFMNPEDRVDVTTNMNLSLLTPAYPTGSMTLYLHNVQTKKEANVFTPATEAINLFLNTDAGIPFGVLPDSSMNLSIPLSGPFGGEEFASTSFDGTFPDAGLNLFIGNTEATGSIPLFTRSSQSTNKNMPLYLAPSLGVHSGLSTFMIRGYDDDLSGV